MARILVFGAGSIGAVYVYIFMKAGATVTAVCRSNYEAVKRDGFTIHSTRLGNVHCQPNVVRTVAEAASNSSEPWDFLVICNKSFPGSSPSLSDMIRSAVGPSTAIVLLQNGIAIEEDVAAAFPKNPILSGVVYVPATQIRPGVIDCGTRSNNLLEIGTYPASAPQSHKRAAEEIASLIRTGGADAVVYDDVQPRRWSKLIVNASWNPITALSQCNIMDFRDSSPGAIDFVRAVMLEVVKVATAEGIEGIDEALVETLLRPYLTRVDTKEPSMLQDVRKGQPFEIEAIVGNTVSVAKAHRVEVPLLNALYVLGKGLFEAKAKYRRSSLASITPAGRRGCSISYTGQRQDTKMHSTLLFNIEAAGSKVLDTSSITPANATRYKPGEMKTFTGTSGEVIPFFAVPDREKKRRAKVVLRKVTPKTFRYFPKLAPELRNIILKYAIADAPARTVSIYLSTLSFDKHKIFKARDKELILLACSNITVQVALAHADIPALLHVNREARSLGLGTYSKTFAPNIHNWDKQGVYFNFEKDILDFECSYSLCYFWRGPFPQHREFSLHAENGPDNTNFCICKKQPDKALLHADLETKVTQISIEHLGINALEFQYVTRMQALRVLQLSDLDQQLPRIFLSANGNAEVPYIIAIKNKTHSRRGEVLEPRFEFPDAGDAKRYMSTDRSTVIDDLPLCNDEDCAGNAQVMFKRRDHKHFIPWTGDAQDEPVVLF
ncbi:Uncharacterized protein LCER1_G005344 [Lachnellula cervina]|uniref:2-dehydropantoate 2-reductase n=1 Tax=Lachnellula cervina TaxID=1316786 RepID=A0A7D8UZH9_9HELO|nr:Uncharacterized protein LCER1_G005344 [Lachnellula cervina]